MQVQFNRPVTLKGVTYGKGLHAVPDEDVKGDWFFDALVKDGDAVIMRVEKPVEPVKEEEAEQPEIKKTRRGK